MLVTIRLFARLRELTGTSELRRQVPDGASAGDAWRVLVGEFPALGDYTQTSNAALDRYSHRSARRQ